MPKKKSHRKGVDITYDDWVQCNKCSKWRKISSLAILNLPDVWDCTMNSDKERNKCTDMEETFEESQETFEETEKQKFNHSQKIFTTAGNTTVTDHKEPTTSASPFEISTEKIENLRKEDCTKLCLYLNQNHGALVYAMAFQAACEFQFHITEIQNPLLVEMDSQGYTVSFELLSYKSSPMKEIRWLVSFPHPMSTLEDIQTYFIHLHTSLLSPKISWIITDWRMRIIVPTVACLGYITHIIGMDSFIRMVEIIQNEWAQWVLQKTFRTAFVLAHAIRISWYFSIIAHTMEAIYVAYLCLSVLKLKLSSTLAWFYLTCLVGFPSTVRVLKLVKFQGY